MAVRKNAKDGTIRFRQMVCQMRCSISNANSIKPSAAGQYASVFSQASVISHAPGPHDAWHPGLLDMDHVSPVSNSDILWAYVKIKLYRKTGSGNMAVSTSGEHTSLNLRHVVEHIVHDLEGCDSAI
ncbi:hypothetical protein HPP92_028901 [Vanilla planifolia]|uniref:Uncharacterized protein n=1 Tax=Vanilla planifolia TaxID=51239 RepID=A0A835U1S7_VANPL|nr:hypothetical protein HPP92_028901 [Vanilla planifolia]KAG0446304.1 hypothetical protein HPP92_028891 [Vanilla planifolia]